MGGEKKKKGGGRPAHWAFAGGDPGSNQVQAREFAGPSIETPCARKIRELDIDVVRGVKITALVDVRAHLPHDERRSRHMVIEHPMSDE